VWIRLDTDQEGNNGPQKIGKNEDCKILNIYGHQTMDESGITLKKCCIRIRNETNADPRY
jgi:hypothetical protein